MFKKFKECVKDFWYWYKFYIVLVLVAVIVSTIMIVGACKYHEQVEELVEAGYAVHINGVEYSSLPNNYSSYLISIIPEDKVVVLSTK